MRSFKLLIVVTCAALTAEPVRSAPSETRITPPGATVIVEFAERVDDAVSRDLLDWIDHVADQVSMPYGRFPLATIARGYHSDGGTNVERSFTSAFRTCHAPWR